MGGSIACAYSTMLFVLAQKHLHANIFLHRPKSYTISALYNSSSRGKFIWTRHKAMENNQQSESEETSFVEFRRKVRAAEVLSAAMERLLWSLHFNGRVSVVVQNGRVLKSGYEEGYFRQLPTI